MNRVPLQTHYSSVTRLYWACRSSKVKSGHICLATVKLENGAFTRGDRAHNHPGDPRVWPMLAAMSMLRAVVLQNPSLKPPQAVNMVSIEFFS